MSVNLSPVGGVAAQFLDNMGNVLTGGKLFTYAAGTTVPAAVFTTSLGTTPHPNPIVLDAAGRVPSGGEIWLVDSLIYKFVLQNSAGVVIATYDNITGINSNFVNFTAHQEIQTATAGQTVFNLTTMQYQPGTNSLAVYVDGVNQYGSGAQYAYVETDSDTVTFVSGLPAGSSVKFSTTIQTTTGAVSASTVSYTPPFTGSVSRNVSNKLGETASVKDFGDDLATAIAAIGSSFAHLIVSSSVTITSDLTIPSNISLRVEGSGQINVTSGKRLYINGPFSAPKFLKCFNAQLLTTTITASISTTSLIVTAVSNSVLASGHVITGGGLAEGVTIAQGWNGGIGTYTLNGDWGTVPSTTFTATGASVIFGAGTVDCVYPQWFGAVSDGTTDNVGAFRHAVYSQVWGGTVSIPAGNYKVSGSTVLHGGMTISGDGVVNISNGAPSPNETAVSSHVWVSTDNASIWVIPVRADRITVRNLSHGSSASTSSMSPIGIGRCGILFNGHAPQFVYAPVIDNCYFYNLDRGIFVNDSYAASSTNWGVNPGTVRNCQFVYCSYGILFYTDNADAWKIDQCVFILAANSSGVHLLRCGFLKLDTCFAFGGSLANSEFVKIAPIDAENPVDSITIDNCQAEFCSHFLTYGGSNTRSFDINLRNCIAQLGADIYLGNICQFNSQNSHLMAFVYYNHAEVKINSINDWFEYLNFSSGATWGYVNAGSGSTTAIHTYIPGKYPSSVLGTTARFSAFSINKEPNVQTVDNYNVTPADVTVIINRSAPTTIVLPFGYQCPGRKIRVVTRQAQTVVSSQGNIIPIIGGSSTNNILPASAGKWVDLESDGTYWVITAGN